MELPIGIGLRSMWFATKGGRVKKCNKKTYKPTISGMHKRSKLTYVTGAEEAEQSTKSKLEVTAKKKKYKYQIKSPTVTVIKHVHN